MRLIDADALNAAFLDYPKMLTFNGGFCAVNLDAVLLEIRKAPTIEAEPVRHGRWEINELGYLVCTNCAWVRYGIPLVEHYQYCPNCGAKMDGGGDE